MQLSQIALRTLEKCSNKLCEVEAAITWPGYEMQLSEIVMSTHEKRSNKLCGEEDSIADDCCTGEKIGLVRNIDCIDSVSTTDTLPEMPVGISDSESDCSEDEWSSEDTVVEKETAQSDELAQWSAELSDMVMSTNEKCSNKLCEVEAAITWPGFEMQLSEMVMATHEKRSNKLCQQEDTVTCWLGLRMQLSQIVVRTLEKCSNKLCELGETITWPGFEMQLSEMVMTPVMSTHDDVIADMKTAWSEELAQRSQKHCSSPDTN
jgi:hypothetical protein